MEIQFKPRAHFTDLKCAKRDSVLTFWSANPTVSCGLVPILPTRSQYCANPIVFFSFRAHCADLIFHFCDFDVETELTPQSHFADLIKVQKRAAPSVFCDFDMQTELLPQSGAHFCRPQLPKALRTWRFLVQTKFALQSRAHFATWSSKLSNCSAFADLNFQKRSVRFWRLEV